MSSPEHGVGLSWQQPQMVPQCSFKYYFLHKCWCQTISRYTLAVCITSFEKWSLISVIHFKPILSFTLFVLAVIIVEILYWSWILVLFRWIIPNIYYFLVACLFMLLSISFAGKKPFTLLIISFVYFCFDCLGFWGIMKNIPLLWPNLLKCFSHFILAVSGL